MQSNISPLRERKSLVDTIIEWLRSELIKGNLKPGDRLPSADQLARDLGVGRSSLREAFQVLSALGVLEVRHGDGTWVAKSSGKEILTPLSFGLALNRGTAEDLIQLRKVIELGSVEFIIKSATDEDVENIMLLAERFKKLSEQGASAEELTEADIAFHKALLKATRNPLLRLVGSTVLELFHQSMRTVLSLNNGPAVAVDHHLRLARALEVRDEQTMQQVVEESLMVWSTTYKSSIIERRSSQ